MLLDFAHTTYVVYILKLHDMFLYCTIICLMEKTKSHLVYFEGATLYQLPKMLGTSSFILNFHDILMHI